MRTDQAQQFAQRGHRSLGRSALRRAPGFGDGGAPVGRAPQRDAVVALQLDQYRTQNARTLRLCLAVQMKCGSRIVAVCIGLQRLGRPPPGLVGAPRQGLQQVPGVLKVTPP
jgi:hypothetical protein